MTVSQASQVDPWNHGLLATLGAPSHQVAEKLGVSRRTVGSPLRLPSRQTHLRPLYPWAACVGSVLFILASASSAAPGTSSFADTDGDGLPDWASVSDWDGDGFLEMKDIQDAIDFLTDPGGIVVEVGPGDFCPPDPSGTNGLCPDEPIYGTYGLIELPSNATLRCDGIGSTLLNGTHPVEFATPGSQRAVISNRDRFAGNQGITIEACDVHAGMDSSYDSSMFSESPSVRGIDLWNITNVMLSNNRVRWTAHAAIYTKNAVNLVIDGNTTTDCGGLLDVRTIYRQPCVYIFSDGGPSAPTDGVTVSNHYAARARNALYNTRRNTHLDILNDVVIRDSIGVDSNSECIALRGGSNIWIQNVLCDDTTGFKTLGPPGGVTAYPSDGGPGSTSALKGLRVLGVTITASRAAAGGTPLSLRSRLEDAQIDDVLVDGTVSTDACFRPEGPWRNSVVRNLVLRNCGTDGINQHGTAGTDFGATLEEGLWIDGLTIDGTDAQGLLDTQYRDGIVLNRDNGWVQIENFAISGFTRTGFALPSTRSLGQLVLRNGSFEGTPNGFSGTAQAAGLPLCDPSSAGAWYSITDAAGLADCQGGGTDRNACACDGAAWIGKENFYPSAAGIQLAGDVYALDITNVSFDNIWGSYGIHAKRLLSNAHFVDIVATQSNEEDEPSHQTSGAIRIEGEQGAAAFAEISCDPAALGQWWNVTDAPSESDCSGGGGSAEAACLCDGAALQPRNVTALGVDCVGGDFSMACVVGVGLGSVPVNFWLAKQKLKLGEDGDETWTGRLLFNIDRRTGLVFDPALDDLSLTLGTRTMDFPAGSLGGSSTSMGYKSPSGVLPAEALKLTLAKQALKWSSKNDTIEATAPGVHQVILEIGSKTYRTNVGFDEQGKATALSVMRPAFVLTKGKLGVGNNGADAAKLSMLLSNDSFLYVTGDTLRIRLLEGTTVLLDRDFTALGEGVSATDKSGKLVYKLKTLSDTEVEDVIKKFSYQSAKGKLSLALAGLTLGALSNGEAHISVELTIGDRAYTTGVTFFGVNPGKYSTSMP